MGAALPVRISCLFWRMAQENRDKFVGWGEDGLLSPSVYLSLDYSTSEVSFLLYSTHSIRWSPFRMSFLSHYQGDVVHFFKCTFSWNGNQIQTGVRLVAFSRKTSALQNIFISKAGGAGCANRRCCKCRIFFITVVRALLHDTPRYSLTQTTLNWRPIGWPPGHGCYFSTLFCCPVSLKAS